MRGRKRQVLVNPTWDQLVQQDPLIAFSWYLCGRMNVLLDVAEEVGENLDLAFAGPVVDIGRLERAQSLMWLWILGAYEVVRTMSQAKTCFSSSALQELTRIKKVLAEVRMPAAKMEKPGRRVTVPSDRSPSGWNIVEKDLIVGDPTDGPAVSARSILTEFDRVFANLKAEDVRLRHEQSYHSLG